MKTSASVAFGAIALALAGGVGLASSRQSSPESILPPGFNDPVAPAPTPAPARTPTSGAPAPTQPVAPSIPGDVGTLSPSGAPTPTPSGTPTPEPIDLSAYELPASARRSLSEVGAIGPGSGGVTLDAFAGSGGMTVERLMRRLDAPLPSRWLSIALRRALVSRVAPPRGVNGADFAAERAWLLLRMGEADMARAVVQSVDVDDYTPKMYQVAMQAMLANGDPAGACTFVEPASKVSHDKAWALSRAMCSALAGKGDEARAQLRAARNGRTIDSLLPEKVIGAAASGGAVTIEDAEWNGVDRLTAWRYGLATATGVTIPEALFGTVRPQVASWRATSPMVDPVERAKFADVAARQGVLSSEALVDLYSEIEATDDSNTVAGALARDLRSTYQGSPGDRVSNLKQVWGDAGAGANYARLVLTARAAAGLRPDVKFADDSGRIVASILTAGLDLAALRWRTVTPVGSDGWAMLALANPRRLAIDSGQVGSFGGGDPVKAKMFFAAAAGLGRLTVPETERLAQSLDVKVGAENSWTRAIAAAADRHEAGTVLLLTAVGMQTSHWRGVPPEVLFHSLTAMRAVGLEGPARMIAAEAIARL